MNSKEMRETPAYTEFHPRWYRERVSTYWWLWKWSYLKFVLREISSVFVAWFIVVTLVLIAGLSWGPEAYAEWQAWMRLPAVIAVNVVSFFFVLVHALTWFNLAPRAIVMRVGGKRLPDAAVAGANYAAWAIASAILAWLVMRRG